MFDTISFLCAMAHRNGVSMATASGKKLQCEPVFDMIETKIKSVS